MKNNFCSTCVALMAVLLFNACSFFNSKQPSNNDVVRFDVVPAVLQMKVGDVGLLDLSLTTTSNVVWSSSDEEVATVAAGVVSANGIGMATITAAIGESKASATVYVSGSAGQTLSLNRYQATLNKGEQFQFVCRNTYGTELTWKSDNEAVATVDGTGLVTGVKPGVAKITVSSGLEELTANIAVSHKWGEYQLVWEEEFNGTELDRSVWNIEVNGNGGGNQEAQYYTDRQENLRVEDGNLVIQLRKEEYKGKHYTSGRIQTRGNKSFTYGKMEARIMFPSGKGTWPAFWMLGQNGGWPACGEIDIIEHIGSRPAFSSFALHTQMKNGSNGTNWHSGYTADQSMENEFHVYGIEWLEEESNGCDQIRFLVDDEVYATETENLIYINQNNYWPFNKPHFFIINLAVGGTMGGNIDDSMFANDVLMKVDWVRVWQREEVE